MQVQGNTGSGILLIVGTPIGNLGDFSPRAAQALKDCDFIAAEDTRVTIKLLNRFDIKKDMISYHEHNAKERGPKIIERILNGETCVLVSDAGMPAISDPGQGLVELCAKAGITVSTVPGPTAVITALALSGLDTGRFTFEGFLTVNKTRRREHLLSLAAEQRTMVFYEAPHKLRATLRDLYQAFGERRITIVKELTKMHEQVIRTTLKEAAAMHKSAQPKGEFVLVVEGAPPENPEEEISLEQAVLMAVKQIDFGDTASMAAKDIAKLTGYTKADIYNGLMEYKGKK